MRCQLLTETETVAAAAAAETSSVAAAADDNWECVGVFLPLFDCLSVCVCGCVQLKFLIEIERERWDADGCC